MPAYIEFPYNQSNLVPTASNVGKVILSVSASNDLYLKDNAGNVTIVGGSLQSALEKGNTAAINIEMVNDSNIVIDPTSNSSIYFYDPVTGNSLQVKTQIPTDSNILTFPDATGTLITSINGYAPDASGSVTIPTGSFSGSYTGSFIGALIGTASYSNRATSAATADYVAIVAGPGIDVNGLEITASVRSVNGVFPVLGNIATTLTAVTTGTSASLQASSSGAITSSITNGLVWIVSNNVPDSSKNGNAYIFVSGSVGQWYLLSGYDTSVYDNRYLKLTPQTNLGGDLNLGGNNINNVGTMFGTASWSQNATNAINSQTASYLPVNTYQVTASCAVSSSQSISSSYAISSSNAISASYSLSSSYAISSSFTITASSAFSSSYATSASLSITSSFATTSSYSLSSSYALSSSQAISSSFATTASYALNSSASISGSYALSSSYSTTASYALNANASALSYIATGSVTASIDIGTGTIFNIISGSTSLMRVSSSGLVTIPNTLSLPINAGNIINLNNGGAIFTDPNNILRINNGSYNVFNVEKGTANVGNITLGNLTFNSLLISSSGQFEYRSVLDSAGNPYFNITKGYAGANRDLLGANEIVLQVNNKYNGNPTNGGISRGIYIDLLSSGFSSYRAIENTIGNVTLNTTSGNTIIGSTLDSGFKLDVNGTTRSQGKLTISTGGATIIGNTNVTGSFSVDNSNGSLTLSSGSNSTLTLNSPSSSIVFSKLGSYIIQLGYDQSKGFYVQDFSGGIAGDYINFVGKQGSFDTIQAGAGLVANQYAALNLIGRGYAGGANVASINLKNSFSTNPTRMIIYDNANIGSPISILPTDGNLLVGTTTDLGYRLNVSGSGNFTNGLTTTGSLLAPSITGSLKGTASFAITASYIKLIQGTNITINYTADGIAISGSAGGSGGSGANDIGVANSTQIQLKSGSLFIGSPLTVPFATTSTTASYVTGSVFIGSNIATSASYAITASYVLNSVTDTTGLVTTSSFNNYTSSVSSRFAGTASYASQSLSSSFAATASFAPNYVLNSQTSSMLLPYVLTTATSSMSVATASFVTSSKVFGPNGANTILSSSYSLTSSYVSPVFISASAAASGFGSGTGGSTDVSGLLTTSSFNSWTGSNSSRFSGTASYALTASFIDNAQFLPIVIECKIDTNATPSLIAKTPNITVAGLTNGSTIVTSANFINRQVEVFKNNILMPGIDLADGTDYITKVYSSNTITFSVSLNTDDYIKIKCL